MFNLLPFTFDLLPSILFPNHWNSYIIDSMKKRKLRIFFGKAVVLGMSIFFILGGVGLLWAMTLEIPDFEAFLDRKVVESTKIYDRTGEVLLYDVNRDLKRTVVPLSEMSRHVKNATVAIEDDNFYYHKGIEPTAILRALYANIVSGKKAQGGSTITQQVVKNTLLTKEKLFTRKIKEVVLAVRIEQELEKDDILELYLNDSPYGGSLYGVEEASRAFFGVSAADLSLAQATYLAALPQAPTYYSPYGNNREALEARQNLVLSRMETLGFINKEEAQEAREENVIFVPRSERGIKAPHFVMYVYSILEKTYGRDVLETGGLDVITTLDWTMQQTAQEIVSRRGETNATNYNANNLGLVAIDPKTGQILAMVGSRDYFNESIDGSVNTTITHRQPGSSFKPFVYATAFKKGLTPETVVFDLRTQFDTTCNAFGVPIGGGDPSRCYTPVNYDDIFRGPISLRNALAQSINVPAIKVLYLTGIKDSIETARAMGIRGLDTAARYGLTLVLGGGEVSLLDITGAYSVFANDGVRNQPTPILRVEGRSGTEYESFSLNPTRVLEPNIARLITDILTDNNARTPSYGANSPLLIPGRDVAVKTGTTNDYRDAWIIGSAPNLAVGVWAGNNDNSAMEKRVAGFIVAPVWNEFMSKTISELPREYFSPPEPTSTELKPILRGVWQGGGERVVDVRTGEPATETTPPEFTDVQQSGGVHNILHWVKRGDLVGAPPTNPQADSQYNLWEIPVQSWLAAQNPNGEPAQASEEIMDASDVVDTTTTDPVIGSQ